MDHIGLDHIGIIAILYVAGVLLLVAEVFVPSHGLLTLGALACLGVAVYHTFVRSTTAGIVGTIGCMIVVPTILMLGIKYVQYLPMGDKLAPPNPTAEETGCAYDRSDCEAAIGKIGRAVTPLRPVGICDFDGRRIQCTAESGMIDADTVVVGVDMHLHHLVVRSHESTTTET